MAMMVLSFDELDEALAGPDCDIIWLELGSREQLGAGVVVRAAEASIGGYEDDPRSLWDIPAVTKFLRRVMRQAGITHWSHPAVKAMNESSLALLIKCGVFGADHPYRVNIVTDDEEKSSLQRFRAKG